MASSRFAALLPPSAKRFIFWELMEMMAISLMAKKSVDENQDKDEHDTGPYVHMEKNRPLSVMGRALCRCAARGCMGVRRACTQFFAASLHTSFN